VPVADFVVECKKIALWKKTCSLVTAVTERLFSIGDTPVVNMVRKVSKKSLLRAGRYEAAVERGSRCLLRLYRDTQ